MDYTPRYRQPFTLAHAIRLDVAVINEEISRLENSLKHLRETQDLLAQEQTREAEIGAEPDHEVIHAIEENKIVIGAQEERISMLRMAMTVKGASSNSGHYTYTDARSTQPSTAEPAAETASNAPPVNDSTDGGLDL